MQKKIDYDNITISQKSHKILDSIINEHPDIIQLIRESKNGIQAKVKVSQLAYNYLLNRPDALSFYEDQQNSRSKFEKLTTRDLAAIRILDYATHTGLKFKDQNLRGIQ